MHADQLREWMNIVEAVNSNYLYHSTQDAATAKAILNSGYFKAGDSNQDATDAQVQGSPTISFGRDLRYQISGSNVGRNYQVVFVIDRTKLESRYKTVSTSQSRDIRNAPFKDPYDKEMIKRRVGAQMKFIDKNKDGVIDNQEKAQQPLLYTRYFAPKAGEEFEEVVPVKSGKLPLKGILVGFYLVPGKPASQDPELVNHPLRLDMPKPNVFVKANTAT
jgi:hypothetical protein